MLEGLRRTLERSRPVIALELTIDPALDEVFGSEADQGGFQSNRFFGIESFEDEPDAAPFGRQEVRKLTSGPIVLYEGRPHQP